MLVPFLLALVLEACFLTLQWAPLAYVLGGDTQASATFSSFGRPYELSLLPVLQTILVLQLVVLAIFLVPALTIAVREYWPMSDTQRRKRAVAREAASDESLLYISLYLFSVFVKGFMAAVMVWFLDDLIQMTQTLVSTASYQSDAGVVLILTNCLTSLQQAWLYGLVWLVLLAVEISGCCFYLGRATAGSQGSKKSS